jgi:pimeloyl-ACP methyl ester carboxylesterase
VPTLTRPDGAEIHWETRGDGPVVALANWWLMLPSVLEPLAVDLARDHRVVTYHDRGSGESTRAGPYDLETAATDLAAVIDGAGGPAVIVSTADGANRAIRVASERPELVAAMVVVGGAPLGRDEFRDSETLAGSESVLRALLQQIETDFRAALRTVLTANNAQADPDWIAHRVADQVRFQPQEATLSRLRAWVVDQPSEQARATQDRLWVLASDGGWGGWLPVGDELRRMVGHALPDARIVDVDDGMVSRPDQTAAVVRTITGAGPAEAAVHRGPGQARE